MMHSTYMKIILFFIVLVTWNFLYSQDTLVQSNSEVYGFGQEYILYSDSTFIYSSYCYCTGFKDMGKVPL